MLLATLQSDDAAVAALGIVMMLVMVFFGLAFLVLFVYLQWRTVAKSGHPGALSLLWLVPLVNIVMPIWFAFSEWPIEREVKRLKGESRENA